MAKKLTTKEFISKARKVHGDRYGYSRVEYVGAFDKVTIVCKEHGEFQQQAGCHTQGRGCLLCRHQATGDRCRDNKEVFINKARKVHGNKYGYEQVKYINSQIKVKILCKVHGIFEQAPASHLYRSSCPKCAGKNSVDTSSFTEEARKVHGNRYGYGKVEYTGCGVKVTILCETHGEFQQKPSSHLNGSGCPTCGKQSTGDSRRLTRESFIQKSRKVHGGIYGYDKVCYINNSTRVAITCKAHGEFQQIPANHLRGEGCLLCGRESTVDKLRTSQSDFVQKAQTVHGKKYSYSKVRYVRSHEKIIIVCPVHGQFEQTPADHLTGRGCIKCRHQATGDRCRSTCEDFVTKAKKAHRSYYDYSKVHYINNSTRITIICPKHGDFAQQPQNHLNGSGCPSCSESKGEKEVKRILENLRVPFLQQFRIPECHNSVPLRFDFDCWIKNKPYLIEFQGGQHFFPVKYFGGQKTFKYLRHCDRIKTHFCRKNHIPLLIIPYWERNIEGVVRKFLKK